jgi:hypothetical protein
MPTKLYKYRAFSVLCLRAITEAEIFYARPNSFNDPMDCDPTIEVDMSLASLEKLLFKLLSRTRDRKAATARINALRALAEELPDDPLSPETEDYTRRLLASEIRSELDGELGNAGVLSLSATWRSALMWSHYADEHRGICIEYDTSDQQHPRLAPVSYRSPRAIRTSDIWLWKVRDDNEAKLRVMKTYFFAKSPEWKYEREWRDVADASGPVSVPYRMTGIHFGMRCDSSVITSIVKLLADRRNIRLWQVLPKDDGFQLRRSAVPRAEIEAAGVREPAFLMFKDVVWPDPDEEPVPEPKADDIPAVEQAAE